MEVVWETKSVQRAGGFRSVGYYLKRPKGGFFSFFRKIWVFLTSFLLHLISNTEVTR